MRRTWNSYHSVLDLFSEVRLSSLFHLHEDHRRDLLSLEYLFAILQLNLDAGFAVLVDDLKRKHLHVALNFLIGKPDGHKQENVSLNWEKENKSSQILTYLRPMRRLASKTVRVGLLVA